MINSKLGAYKHNNYYLPITIKDISNPYCVYLPHIHNNKIKQYIFIHENNIAIYLYNHYNTNINVLNNTSKNLTTKIYNFIRWLKTFNNINISNWEVIMYKLYKSNLLK